MMEALADQVELNSLIMTDNKKSFLKRQADLVRDNINRIANYDPGQNGVATAAPATPTTGDDESGIVNRSPRTDTTNNNYPVKSDAPWVALIAMLLVLGLAALAMWWSMLPKPAVVAPMPVPVTTTPTTPVTTGGTRDPNYIEFYRP